MTEKHEKSEKNEQVRRDDSERGADGPDYTDEFRPEPVKQRESEGQAGPGEAPQVTPEKP
ncbi:hypothetical protein [Actinomadura sp. 21ATH]|uniref:hypothetical protein n=1 Tax=Actinomadura sp. 21ATH TaxID=1735444 RepID=UPI0035BFD26C